MIAFLSNTAMGEGECRYSYYPPYDFECVDYVDNYDGDTIKVDIYYLHPLAFEEISVRIRGIDTPEINGSTACERKWAKIIKKTLRKELVKAKQIDLRNAERGKYFRYVTDVYVDGKNIADFLLKLPGVQKYGEKFKCPDSFLLF